MIVLRELAPAKINLYLHVTGKRNDGYHLLDSLVTFVDMGDKLEALPGEALSLTVTGPFAASLSGQDNSVLKAAQALRQQYKISAGAALTLHKHLPVSSGIGGGSADAAAALRLLLRLWKIMLPAQELHRLALRLGADVPACLNGRTLYMGGIGETLEPGPSFPALSLLLVNPGKPLLTSEVFAGVGTSYSSAARHPAAFASLDACVQFLAKAKNDLEPVAIQHVPEIETVLESLRKQKDCLLARMSGSGATCYGIFANAQAALSAEAELGKHNPGWWVKKVEAR